MLRRYIARKAAFFYQGDLRAATSGLYRCDVESQLNNMAYLES